MVRKKRLEIHRGIKNINPIWNWTDMVPAWKVVRNFIIIFICRYSMSLPLKNFLYRRLGMVIGKHVSFGLMVMVDVFFPEQIEVGDNSIIGYNTTLLGHEFLCREWRVGKVKIGKDVMIGANCTVLPGVVIGDGSQICACSLVNKDIPPGVLAGGVPIKVLHSSEEKMNALY